MVARVVGEEAVLNEATLARKVSSNIGHNEQA